MVPKSWRLREKDMSMVPEVADELRAVSYVVRDAAQMQGFM